jgi:hypothetical protein
MQSVEAYPDQEKCQPPFIVFMPMFVLVLVLVLDVFAAIAIV